MSAAMIEAARAALEALDDVTERLAFCAGERDRLAPTVVARRCADALRTALAAAEAQPVGKPVALADGFEDWWRQHRVTRVLNPAGVARMVWEASARHNRSIGSQP